MSQGQSNLRVAHINVYHLVPKLTDVSVYVNGPSPIHILGVTETRLKPHHSDTTISIPNYSVFRRDADSHVTGQTGIAVYTHNSISNFVRRRPDLETKQVECIWLELKSPLAPSLLICILYRNGRTSTLAWYDDFYEMCDKARIHSTDVLILGDLNIDMLVPHTIWDSVFTMLGLTQVVTAPTRVTNSTATLIDHIYTNKPQAVSDVNVDSLGISDHFPVSCTWSTKLPKSRKSGHTYISYRSFKNFDVNHFFFDLNQTPFNIIHAETDPDIALSAWYTLFLSVLDKHAPVRRKRVRSDEQPQWLNQEIIHAMKYRDKLRREKRFDEFKSERKRVKLLIRQAKKSLVDQLIKQDKEVRTLWKAMSVVTGDSKRRSRTIPCDLTPDIFNSHFLSVADSIAPPTGCTQQHACTNTLINFCRGKLAGSATFSIPSIAVYEVGKFIEKMPNKKSAGFDEISPKILKLSLPYIVESLTHIYNLCISNGTFPDQLKIAKVTPIPKSKEVSDINNYRPISVLPILSKPLERHVHKHLLQHLDSHDLIYPLQSGFRPNHSCHTALARLTNTWLSAMNNKQMTGAVFIDLKKAFDLVDHKILLEKLRLYLPSGSTSNNITNNTSHENTNMKPSLPNATTFFQSYLTNRVQYVSVNGSCSFNGVVTRGVPQGSVLGPLLFGLFINDLPLHLIPNNVSCDLFADDASIHTPDTDINSINVRLQDALKTVQVWCYHNSMVLNPRKTECMLVATRQKLQREPLTLSLTIEGHEIEQVTEHRLLGVTFDDQMKWESHINTICKKVSKNVFLLSKLKGFIDMDTRKMFFNAHIMSHINYCSTTWDGSSDVHKKKLDSLYRRAAKQVLPDPTLTTDQKMSVLQILPLSKHLLYNKGVMMFKVWTHKVPPYLFNMFSKAQSKYETSRKNFDLPLPRKDFYKASLAFSGPKLWNWLPSDIKEATSLPSFKAKLAQFLLSHDPP